MIGTSSVALAPYNKTEVVLHTLAELAGMAGNRGFAQFSVPAGNVSVLGLRFLGGVHVGFQLVLTELALLRSTETLGIGTGHNAPRLPAVKPEIQAWAGSQKRQPDGYLFLAFVEIS